MSRLDRYILKELIVPFCIGTFVIVLMFQANDYMFIAKTFHTENIPLIAQFQWIMYRTPSFLKMTLPVGTALASALVMTRLGRDSEITALRAAGVRILRIIAPVLVVGSLVGVANFYIVDTVIPVATHKAEDLAIKNATLGMSALFKSNGFLELQNFAASLGNVSRTGPQTLSISDILLVDRSDPKTIAFITAKEAKYDRGIWTFTGSHYYQIRDLDLVVCKPLGPFVLDQELGLDQFMRDAQNFSQEETPTPELRREIAATKRAKGDARPAEVELQKRYAIPASCLIFAITGSAFAVFYARSGGFVGLLVSFFIVLLYYNAFIVSSEILGKMDAVPPWVAAWLPNIIFGTVGIVAIRRLE